MTNPTINLGAGEWATKEGELLGYSKFHPKGFLPQSFDFTRASSATVVNKQGLIETVEPNVPRIDFNDDANGALLLEPESRNLVKYSEYFSDASWIKQNISTLVGQGISPNGSNTLTLLTSGSITSGSITSSQSRLQSSFDTTTNQEYSFSCYVKFTSTITTQIYLAIGGTGRIYLNSDGTFTTRELTGFISATALPFGNGIFRISVSVLAPTTSTVIFLGFSKNGNETFTTTGGDTILVWGAQLEEKSYATSYIPNYGTTEGITRLADSASKTGLSSYINSEEGVLYANMKDLGNDDTTDRQISICDASVSNRVSLQYNKTDNLLVGYILSGGVIKEIFTHTLSSSLEFIKVALKYSNGDCSLWVNGTETNVGSTFTTFVSSLTSLQFDRGNGASPFYGKIKDLRVYNEILSDTELETLTTL